MEDEAGDRLVIPPRTTLAHPAFVHAMVWLLVLGLFNLRLTSLLLPLNAATLNLVLSSVAAGIAIGLLGYALLPKLRPHSVVRETRELEQLYRWRQWALTIWAVCSVGEIAVARGLPIVWLVTGDTSRDYRNFGIPTIHGLLTALFLFSVAATAVEIFVHGRRRQLRLLLPLLVWLVLQVNRGALIWSFCQVAGVFLLARQLRIRTVALVTAAVLAGVLLFGVIGDARSGQSGGAGVRSVVPDDGGVLVERLPSGFLWVYLYTTTPLNNIVRAIGTFEPGGSVYFSVAALLPTVIRQLVFTDPDRKYPVGLVNEAFNTSTWFASFLADFGPAGAVGCTAVLQLIAMLFYRPARVWRPWALVGFSACFQAIALSVFADTFTSLVSVAQLAIALALQAAAGAQASAQAVLSPPDSMTQ